MRVAGYLPRHADVLRPHARCAWGNSFCVLRKSNTDTGKQPTPQRNKRANVRRTVRGAIRSAAVRGAAVVAAIHPLRRNGT